jgi:hypothetical protein
VSRYGVSECAIFFLRVCDGAGAVQARRRPATGHAHTGACVRVCSVLLCLHYGAHADAVRCELTQQMIKLMNKSWRRENPKDPLYMSLYEVCVTGPEMGLLEVGRGRGRGRRGIVCCTAECDA